MTEMYWITRLDAICAFLAFMIILGVTTAIISFVLAICNNCNETYQTLMCYFKRSIIVTLVLIIINIFIPTKNDALLIYGVGGTIDYIKSNNTAKQLPDKCIKALDKWVDNLNEKEEQDKKVE